MVGEVLPIAQAVHNQGGLLIAQVGRLLDQPASPQQVRVPGVMVDVVVLAQGHEHDQTFAEVSNPGYYTAQGKGHNPWAALQPLPLDERKIIAARACDEVPPDAMANLGIGMPEGIARVAAERGWLDRFTLTVESGPIGGMPAGGLSFGASLYPQAIVDQPSQFDFYDGSALDFAALGAAQIDSQGNVNVSRFGPKLAGIGGFANITQTARKLVFCGTFTTGGLEVAIEQGKLRIVQEGKHTKFVPRVEHLSFSDHRARQLGQEVWYVTERAVFRLTNQGLELVEVAPGIDVQKQVLDLMAFEPIVKKIQPMPAHVFED
jgi:propionate CoA-transferase